MLVIDRDGDGAQLIRRAEASGFIDDQVGSDRWRVYYLPSAGGEWLVATGQKSYERDEVVYSLTLSQLLPWLVVLPLLLLAMTWAVRRALAPVLELSDELRARAAEDLRPLSDELAPHELKPLVGAMNGLFTRIDATLARERRFTADAAHELRTPLAVLRAQWDVVRGASDSASRAVAERKLSTGMDRMDRLVTQLLALAGVETGLETQRTLAKRGVVAGHRRASRLRLLAHCGASPHRDRVLVAAEQDASVPASRRRSPLDRPAPQPARQRGAVCAQRQRRPPDLRS